mmetsp:Transcript_10818/g.35846  ORF Transcript_10818/g.35846 Transcript_10818/m.35846 type:complete len:208 (+) Transcript_10818:2195-2818(+)
MRSSKSFSTAAKATGDAGGSLRLKSDGTKGFAPGKARPSYSTSSSAHRSRSASSRVSSQYSVPNHSSTLGFASGRREARRFVSAVDTSSVVWAAATDDRSSVGAPPPVTISTSLSSSPPLDDDDFLSRAAKAGAVSSSQQALLGSARVAKMSKAWVRWSVFPSSSRHGQPAADLRRYSGGWSAAWRGSMAVARFSTRSVGSWSTWSA